MCHQEVDLAFVLSVISLSFSEHLDGTLYTSVKQKNLSLVDVVKFFMDFV